jgi:lysozyme
MQRRYSTAARQRLTEPWEEYVGYPYDDKVPKIHGRYPEYTFERPPRGTVTIGFGHTDAAGNLKIAAGMRLSREEAGELEQKDLAPCEAAINRLLKVEVTQHQFDALVDIYFNCPSAAVAAIRLINAGRVDAVPAKLLQYVCSKGERMQGLVNRRNAEIAWFNHPDDAQAPPPVASPDPYMVFCPKGERDPPPKKMVQSKTGMATATIGTSVAAEAMQRANDVLDQVGAVHDKISGIIPVEHLSALVSDPKLLACLAIAGLCGFIWFDRRYKLVNDHV